MSKEIPEGLEMVREGRVAIAPGVVGDGYSAIVSPDASMEAIVMALRTLDEMVRKSPWFIGDVYNQVRAMMPDKVDQIVSMTRLALKTLESYGYTCRRFAPDERFPDLAIGIHNNVAGMEDKEQRDALLREAQRRDMSYHDFRTYVKAVLEAGQEKEEAEGDYGQYQLTKVEGSLSEKSLEKAFEGCRMLTGKDLMALGIVPISDDDAVYVIRQAKRAAGNGLLTEAEDPIVPEAMENIDSLSDSELYDRAVGVVLDTQRASMSLLQRRFGLNHLRATNLMLMLEDRGIIGPINDEGVRPILVVKTEKTEAPFA